MKKRKSGFTLIEMIIVLMLTTIIVGIMYTIFSTGNKVFSDADVKSDLQLEGQLTQETLTNLGMQAMGIKEVDGTDFASGDPDDINKKETYMKNFSSIKKIVLNIAERDADLNDLEKFNKGTTSIKEYNLNLNGTVLSTGSGKILSRNVKTFEIKANDTGVEFKVTLEATKGFAKKTYPVKVNALFRNKDVIVVNNVTP